MGLHRLVELPYCSTGREGGGRGGMNNGIGKKKKLTVEIQSGMRVVESDCQEG